jgi:transcriptional regulator with XRE-family HTH domain
MVLWQSGMPLVERMYVHMMDRFRPEELLVTRLSRGLNLREAAELTGITKETLSALERGQRFPHAHTLKRIADAYGLPVEHFLYTREEVPASPKAPAPTSPQPAEEEERRDQQGLTTVGAELTLRWNVHAVAREVTDLVLERAKQGESMDTIEPAVARLLQERIPAA